MIVTSRMTVASPESVWRVLADGWLYAGWVVGASRIRGVDPGWPAAGARIHHSVGAWPLLVDDETKVVAAVPARSLRLLARTRPFGEAGVRIDLTETADGTRIDMREDVVSGPATMLPAALRQRSLVPRNRESLRRLALLAEGHAR